MTPKEFTDRTGYTPTEEEYKQIEKMYLNTYIDKDEFCKAWQNNRTLLEETVEQTIIARKLAAERNDMVDFLLNRAQELGDAALLNKAIEMVGHAEVIKRKLSLSLELWPIDKKYIKEHIQ